MGMELTLSPREVTDLLLVTSTIGTVIIGSGWFFFTSLFYRTSDRTADQEHTTVAPAAEGGKVLSYATPARKQTDARAD